MKRKSTSIKSSTSKLIITLSLTALSPFQRIVFRKFITEIPLQIPLTTISTNTSQIVTTTMLSRTIQSLSPSQMEFVTIIMEFSMSSSSSLSRKTIIITILVIVLVIFYSLLCQYLCKLYLSKTLCEHAEKYCAFFLNSLYKK